ncbi:MAG TPA: MFS transporter, partial [Bacillales bacterium]|nr:MFS transporter [Bacillales bacterium]
RKKLMAAADVMACLTFATIAFLNSPWFDLPYASFALFVVNMFFSGILGPVAQAMIIDVTDSQDRKFVFAFSYWAINLAVAVGGVLGAFLFPNHHFLLFLSVSGIYLLSLATTLIFIKESYFPAETAKEGEGEKGEGILAIFKSYAAVLGDKLFMVFVMCGILLFSLDQQLTNYIGVRLGEHVPSQTLFSFDSFHFRVDGFKMLGFLQTENTLIVVAFTVVVGLLIKRFSDHGVLYAGIGLFTIGYFMLGLSADPWVLFAAMAVVSIGEVMYIPVMEAFLADIAPDDKRSSYMAINKFTFYGAMMIAALFVTLGGILPFWVIAALFLLMGGASLYAFHRIMPGLKKRQNRLDKRA